MWADPRRDDPVQRVRMQAREAVQYALKTGRLVRGECAQADASCKGRIEAHHESYERDRWLDVTWLCISHHRRRHPHGTPKTKAKKEPTVGVGPTTARLRIGCSTTELRRQRTDTETADSKSNHLQSSARNPTLSRSGEA